MKTKVQTDRVVLPGKSPHSQAIVANGFVFTQGMIYLTPEGTLLEGSLEDKVKLIMDNLGEVLREAGAGFSDVVKTTIFVTDMASYSTVNQVYAGYFEDPYPARETVCVRSLPLGAEVEISMVAAK